jgi:putative DNA methylase
MERALIEEKTIQHLKLFLEVSEEAKKEKSGRPPISEMIYWWTRKPLIVSRAVTLLSLAPSSVSINTIKQRLHLDSQKRAFKHSPNRADLENAIQKSFDGLKVLDPFAGAGNLMFEPARLGLNCTVVEYNPVAYPTTDSGVSP